MAVQRSVQQQNALAKEEIRRCASLFAQQDGLLWLQEVLRERGHDPAHGVLVRLEQVPEQDGDFYSGTWLNPELDFWQFCVTIDRASGSIIAVETFDNVTNQLAVTKHRPGTGKSFGQLAIEVLRERSDA